MPVQTVQKALAGRHFGDGFALVLCAGLALALCSFFEQLISQHRDAKTIGNGSVNHDTTQDHWQRV